MMEYLSRKPCNTGRTQVVPAKPDATQVGDAEGEPSKSSWISRLQSFYDSRQRKPIIIVGVVVCVIVVLSVSVAVPLSAGSSASSIAASKGTNDTTNGSTNGTTNGAAKGTTNGAANGTTSGTNDTISGKKNSTTNGATCTNGTTSGDTNGTNSTTNSATNSTKQDFRSCEESYAAGFTNSGIYEIITPDNNTIDVYCDHGNREVNSGWTMVFKAVSGVPLRVHSPSVLWLSSSTLESASASALPINSSSRQHYKNRIIQQWHAFNPRQVRLSLYKKKTEVIRLIFRATGSTKINWFTRERLVRSPWTDIHSQSVNYFSISGDDNYKRTFFINSKYGGCPVDEGWMVLLEKDPGVCTWENHIKPMFSILYSSISSRVLWTTSDAVSLAEMMAIYIR